MTQKPKPCCMQSRSLHILQEFPVVDIANLWFSTEATCSITGTDSAVLLLPKVLWHRGCYLTSWPGDSWSSLGSRSSVFLQMCGVLTQTHVRALTSYTLFHSFVLSCPLGRHCHSSKDINSVVGSLLWVRCFRYFIPFNCPSNPVEWVFYSLFNNEDWGRKKERLNFRVVKQQFRTRNSYVVKSELQASSPPRCSPYSNNHAGLHCACHTHTQSIPHIPGAVPVGINPTFLTAFILSKSGPGKPAEPPSSPLPKLCLCSELFCSNCKVHLWIILPLYYFSVQQSLTFF